MATSIQKALLVLAQAVVVLIVCRGKAGAYGKEGWVRGATVVLHPVRPIFVIGNGHLPTIEVKNGFALSRLEIQADIAGRA